MARKQYNPKVVANAAQLICAAMAEMDRLGIAYSEADYPRLAVIAVKHLADKQARINAEDDALLAELQA